ncbi:MAG TPA: chemotaxis protein CheB [Chitinophagaceae bacterium]|nr:chemotaxis protein CheB [Chitinophagaceae bacterium]
MEKSIASNGNQAKTTEAVNAQTNGHCVVAIGASAGGLEAIHEFFDNVPENTNVSFIVVQHLSPDYKSLLVELVSKHTHMNVFEAAQGMPVQKNCVYVIPNNKIMTIRDGSLRLVDKVPEKTPNTAIDIFLQSLAEDRGSSAIAVILSGTGTDGTRGAEAIKAAGGMVLVQDPCTAKFDGMPNSAIASGSADMILAPELMPEEIYGYLQETPIHILNKGKIDEGKLEEIFRLVYKQSGHDFHFYKTPTIIRRLFRRMSHKGIKNLDQYIAYLQEHADEPKALSKDFLIGVTKFFRDPAAFEILYNDVLPEIINKKSFGDSLKLWVSACSTGEEAYSMAIMVDKFLSTKKVLLDVKIFATDIDETALEVASKGVYPESIEGDMSPEILERYFVKEGNQYHINQYIRKQIVFAKHNIIKDPPFIKNDIVTCRNMLIYMSTILQKKVLATLHFSLNHGGFLLLGPSETVSYMQESLEEVNGKWKIYRRNGAQRLHHNDVFYRPNDYGKLMRDVRVTRGDVQKPTRDISVEFKDVLAEDFGFAAFYIDSNCEIREATGNYKKYISLPEGRLHLNLLKMLPPELSIALNTAIRKAQTERKKIIVKNVRIKGKTRNTFISFIVKPAQAITHDSLTLIVFGEERKERAGTKKLVDVSANMDPELHKYIIELEAELRETRSDLQMAIEGLESANEELQSSNEELLSANEELQSSNEELQSLNEELHTLNTEHQLKIRELVELNDDLDNYFRSSDIAQIFLDSRMILRKFNPAAVKLINLIETDVGRPISHISTNLEYPNLLEDIQEVINTGHVPEKEIKLRNGKTSLMRILPYVRQDKQMDGVVLTFVDITDMVLAKERLEHINQELESSNIELQQFASVASHDLKEPLRKIHMFSNLIKDKYFKHTEAEALNYLDRIISSSARMTTLVNDLLSFSRLSINHLFRRTSLNQLLKDIVADLELVVQEKNAVIEVDELPEIDAVPGQLRQVFQNLLSNALKFSKKHDPPRISIKSERVAAKSMDSPADDNGQYCRITITDNGIGFDEQYREKIFTIFQRLHTKEKYEGTGIGLAIARKIIEKHNGIIAASSIEHVGSNFTIVLPMVQEEEGTMPLKRKA